jgi:Putative threonine/serine exporter
MCSALELASKNIVNGSVRMIYAIIYSLFLGFGLTIGSDLYLIVDSRARSSRVAQVAQNISVVSVHGTFIADNSTTIPEFSGSFTFSNGTKIDADTKLGCYHDPSWPWYQQNFPFWTWFLLVPTFSLFSSSWNLQPLKSKQLIAMIFISCAAFAANQAANYYILNRSDVVSAIGAFVVGYVLC